MCAELNWLLHMRSSIHSFDPFIHRFIHSFVINGEGNWVAVA